MIQGNGNWTKDRKKYSKKDPDKIVKRVMERSEKFPPLDHNRFFPTIFK